MVHIFSLHFLLKTLIFWLVSDGCGNDATCSQLVTITNEDKQPTPYCFDGLSVAVMPSTGTVSLWANDFDAGSFDNCEGTLILSMIPDQDTDGLNAEEAYNQSFTHANVTQQANGDWGFMFTCDYIPSGVSAIFEVRIYVTDASGNWDYCTASLRLDDNFDVCEDDGQTGTLTITGETKTEEGEPIELVDVELDANYPEFPKTVMTVEDGQYGFYDLFSGVDYEVIPMRNDNHLNGVTTLDIVMIQKHILGIDIIESPYKLIAADVNSDCQVTGQDLVQLRKLILGKYADDELPENSSWRFVRSEFEFIDGVQPCVYEEIADLYNMTESQIEDFYGVKIGDINESVIPNAMSPAETRTNEQIEMIIDDVKINNGQTIEIPVYARDFNEVYGFQFTMNFIGANFNSIESGLLEFTESNIHMSSPNAISVSYDIARGVTLSNDELLFTVIVSSETTAMLSSMMEINSAILKSEIYLGNNLDIATPVLAFRELDGSTRTAQFVMYQNEPNPFKEQTTIGFILPRTDEATVTVYDVAGKILYNRTNGYAKGENFITIDRKDIAASGILYYKVESGDHVATKKMIILD